MYLSVVGWLSLRLILTSHTKFLLCCVLLGYLGVVPRVATGAYDTPTNKDKPMDKTVYEVTGVDRSGRRFKITTTNAIHAGGINLYRGTVWQVLPSGRRKVLRRVWN